MTLSSADQQLVRMGRSKFVAMAAAYFLGVFNDNFFKQAVSLLAVSAGLTHLQGKATMLFSLPFLLFSAYAGDCADRFSKRQVIIGTKLFEVAAMLLGAYAVYSTNWNLILTVIFLMGLHSTVFGPAINGAIPELYPESYVPKANALLKFASTSAILLGIASGGIVLDLNFAGAVNGFDHWLLAVVAVTIALVGLVAAFGIKRHPAAARGIPFPWAGPLQSVRDLVALRGDRDLLLAVLSSAFFYFVSTTVTLQLNAFGVTRLGLSKTLTSLLLVALMVGICMGAFVAVKAMAKRAWNALLPAAAAGLGLGFLAVPLSLLLPADVRVLFLLLILVATGVAGGTFLIPVVSFIQVRPAPDRKGRILGASNFLDFAGIMLAGFLVERLDRVLSPAASLVLVGALALACAAMLFQRVHRGGLILEKLLFLSLRGLLSLRYRIRLHGFESVQRKGRTGMLFMPNHPALIDPIVSMSILFGRHQVRPLVDEKQIDSPFLRAMLRNVRPILVPDVRIAGRSSVDAARRAVEEVIEALRNGENVLLYPSGMIYRSRHECMWGNTSAKLVTDAVPDAQIVLMRITGLWGSSFGRATGPHTNVLGKIKFQLTAILANLIFFMPRRRVDVRFVEPTDFPFGQDKAVINKYLEDFYNADAPPHTHVPYFWWEGSKPEVRMEPHEELHSSAGLGAVPAEVRAAVDARLCEAIGQQVELRPEQHLARDLGIDSLTQVDLMTWIEQTFGFPQESLEALNTVGACYLAAVGRLDVSRPGVLNPIDSSWFAVDKPEVAEVPSGQNLASIFLAQAAHAPTRVIAADQLSGVMTYRKLILGILALRPQIQAISEERVGIMLPASVGAALVYFATMFSGKTPVFVNWTVGSANLKYSLASVGVRRVLTSARLLERIRKQGHDLSGVGCEWVTVERLRENLSGLDKVRAALQSRIWWGTLRRARTTDTAAILFTSGSEARPKAVPLTHANLIANMRDSIAALGLEHHDRILGMLPPFHSFGLATNIIIPLCAGMRVVYHPNPTEGAVLARVMSAYRASVVIATPTFLGAMLRHAVPKAFGSVRVAVVGAEKCPDSVYDAFSAACPEGLLCEGYGITECSPVVSVNRPGKAVRGTIGHPLASVEWVIVGPDTGKEVSPGERGRLLVRGPSIFGGYLNYDGKSPFVEHAGKQWYDTGDLVTQEPDGSLRFAGRLKRFVKVGGEMVSLPAVEEALRTSLTPGAEEVTLAVEASGAERPELVLFATFPVTLEEANRAIAAQGLSAIHGIRRVVKLEAIPLLGSGKTDYLSLKKMLQTGP